MATSHSPAKDVSFCNLKDSNIRESKNSEHSNSLSFNQSMATLQSWASALSHQALSLHNSASRAIHSSIVKTTSRDSPPPNENGKFTRLADCSKRGLLLVGMGALTASLLPEKFASAEGVPDKYQAFVDVIDGYSYYYPSDWREFDFLGHDSAFKDRFAALQHVRVCFIPTDKKDVHDLCPMEEVIFNLVKNVYAAPTQKPSIFDIQERSVDGKIYWTFEYELESPNFARTAFATIAIGDGRYYTLVVGANQRRWSRVRNKLKVIADSFRMIDI